MFFEIVFNYKIVLALILPLLGTTLGSAMVFF